MKRHSALGNRHSLVTAILARLTDPAIADAIAGDLEEQRRVRAERSRLGAALWMGRTAIGILLRLVLARLRTAASVVLGAVRSSGSSRDLRYAARSVWRAPWYSLASTAIVALGMTLATTTFAIVDGVLFKPLPYERASELYSVRGTYSPELLQTFTDGTAGGWFSLSPRDVEDLAAAVPTARFAMHSGGGSSPPQIGELRAWAPSVASIDARFLDVLGVRPLAGGFAPEDFETAPGAIRPALVTYSFWQSHLGGQAGVIGQTIAPAPGSAVNYRVAGILPASFVYPTAWSQPNLLTPLVVPPAARADRARRSYSVVVRLPAGVDRETYQARFKTVSQAAHRELKPDAWDLAAILPLDSAVINSRSESFPIVFAAALFVVLVASINVSGLMASRHLDRQRELALRRSLGARGRDLARLVFAESALLIAAGTVLGLLLARPAVALVLRLMPGDIGLMKTPAIDVRVMAFAAITALVCAIVVSVGPIRQTLRRPARAVLAAGGPSTARVRSRGRFAVVAVQVALGLVLTLGGALLVGSLVRVWQNDLGHRTDDVVMLEGTPAGATPAERAVSLDAALERIRAIPGVESAGATGAMIWRSGGPGGMLFAGDMYSITAGFVDTLAPRLLEGRWPSAEEIATGGLVVVITPFIVEKVFGGKPVIGQTITSKLGAFTVIGVAQSAMYGGLEWMKGFPQYYVPYRATTLRSQATIVVRTRAHSTDVLSWAIGEYKDRTVPLRLTSAATSTDLLNETVRLRRLQAWLFGSFAVAALVIVGAGVLGLIAMGVARRTREVGIRVALGATRPRIVSLLMREQLLAVAAGIVAGGLVSVWAVQLIKLHVYEKAVYDLRIWSVAVVVIAAVAMAGVVLPARRASSIDPVSALKID